MLHKPYIGITGFMEKREVEPLLRAMPAGRLLMVGVLASAKTLRHEPNTWPNRFPLVEQIKDIFVRDERALNLIHFATDSLGPMPLDEQLTEMIRLGGDALDGFQLNMVWPSPEKLRVLLDHKTGNGRRLRVVLQIGTNAFRKSQEDPNILARHLREYKDVVTDVLFDLSGGLGKPLDAERALSVLRAVREQHPDLGLGVAGGLSAKTIDLLAPILQEFPNVSIDAEGNVRDNKDARLNLSLCAQYIGKATKVFYRATSSHSPS